MTADAILAWLHFISVVSVITLLVAELILVQPALVRESAYWLYRLDLVFFGAAILAVITGLLRAVYGVKGWSFYSGNALFHAKISLFVTVGLLSIWPTLIFMRWGRALRKDPTFMVPGRERRSAQHWLTLELALLLLVPLLASLMARGLKI